MAQQFDDQGVHLTPTAGKMLVEAILMTAEAFFVAEILDLTKEDTEMISVEVASGSTDKGKKYTDERKAQGLENRIINLESEFQNKRTADNLMMARIREELDLVTNIKRRIGL